jgi:hypothetical protein
MVWSSPICNVDVGEALGLLHDINWVHNLQLEGLDFVLDSKNVVGYFHKGQNDAIKFDDVLKECKRAFNLYFENSHVKFDKR